MPRRRLPALPSRSKTCATAQALARGINFGNMLEAPREGDWGVRLEPACIDKVAGVFSTVRVPVRWCNHAALTADAKLDEAFAKRVDQVVDALLARACIVFADTPLAAEDLLLQVREAPPDGDD